MLLAKPLRLSFAFTKVKKKCGTAKCFGGKVLWTNGIRRRKVLWMASFNGMFSFI